MLKKTNTPEVCLHGSLANPPTVGPDGICNCETCATSGTVRANVAQVRKLWRVDSDNVRYFDALVRGNGEVFTLDARPYIEYLTDFGIFFTAPHIAPPIAGQSDTERGARIDAERVTWEFRTKSTRRLDAGRKPITDSPLWGGDAQQELF